MSQIHLSNHLEILYIYLRDSLHHSIAKNPFGQRKIVVYGPPMQSWLTLRLAQDLGIAAGMEFIYLNQAFAHLLNHTKLQTLHLPTLLEFAFMIEAKLRDLSKNYPRLTEAEQHDWRPLWEYLHGKSELRLIDLSRKLAQIIYDYSRSQESSPENGWQRRLWESIYPADRAWMPLAHALSAPIALKEPFELHFFAINFLIKPEWSFIQRLSEHIPIYGYFLSPCMHFWSDIRSDRETASLLARWESQVKNYTDLKALDDLLQDRNSLLANNGYLGRSMAYLIEESSAQVESHYVEPTEISGAIQAIQRDILLMKNPEENSPHELPSDDRSIQVHLAANKRREIECLYHSLITIINKEQPDITPRDILVMAPHITEYLPYIQAVFGSPESQLKFQVLDSVTTFQNEMIQGFLTLLALADSQWEASHVLQLLSYPSFQRKMHLSKADCEQIREWINAKQIHWGIDLKQRNEILQRHHCQNRMEDRSGSWDHGFQLLLDDLVTPSNLNFSQTELLNKLMLLIYSLQDDLALCHDQTAMPVHQWVDYLQALLETYFSPELADDYNALKNQFERLAEGSSSINEERFPFISIKTHLISLIEQAKGNYAESQYQIVRFSSLPSLRALPSKVIALLGMHEDAFPRHVDPLLRHLAGSELISGFPQNTQEDRGLFLEILQSVRQYLLIFYPLYEPKEGVERAPSLVIQELISYLDNNYTVGGETWSKKSVHRHPFESYHSNYFEKSSTDRNYFLSDFKVSEVYSNRKKRSREFMNEFEKPGEDIEMPETMTLDIKYLNSIAKKPIKFFLNQGLGVYLDNSEKRKIVDSESLILSPLERYQVKKEALQLSLNEILSRVEQRGKLPLGLFKEVALLRIKEEVEEIHESLKDFDIDPSTLFNIEFTLGCSVPKQIDAKWWCFPAIPLNEKRHIIGKLENISPQGLVAIGKDKNPEVWKQWPAFLVLCKAIELFSAEIKPQLIMTGAKTPILRTDGDLDTCLNQWMHYHQICSRQFSPLMPDWLPAIFADDSVGLEKEWLSIFDDERKEKSSLECRWIFNRDALPNATDTIQNWKGYAELLFKR